MQTLRLFTSLDISRRIAERVREISPDIEIWSPREDGTLPPQADETDIVYFSEEFWTPDFYKGLLPRMVAFPRLRWMHLFTHGADHALLRALVIDRHVKLTRSYNAMSPPMAQYVIAMLLRIAKRMDAWTVAQAESTWRPHACDELTGRTLGIVGTGQIGVETGRLAKAFNMRVLGYRRRDEVPPNFDAVFRPERLHELLSQCDYVLLALPLVKETVGIIDAAAIAEMQPHAWLINVARGRLIDDAALLDALRARRIAGACLDAFAVEPLPPTSELWRMPNVIVTPHNSIGRSPLAVQRAIEAFLANLARYVLGDALLHEMNGTDFPDP